VGRVGLANHRVFDHPENDPAEGLGGTLNIQIAMVVVGILVFCVFFALALALFRRNIDVVDRVQTSRTGKVVKTWIDYVKSMESVFKPLGEVIPRSAEEMSRQEKRLTQAGIRRKDGVVLFHGTQFALSLFFVAICLGVMPASRYTVAWVLISLFMGAALPDIWLSRAIDGRKERIQLAIPDALDLAVICVEAGLGLDQSMLRIAEELDGPYPDLADEFRLRNIEINMGRNRTEAFRNLATRTGVEDLKALVAILIQTDKFGTSVGQSLRVFADSLRVKRQQRARERAAKLPIKMIPIMILFIFPSIFVVVVGPAVIQIIRTLLPVLNSN
jgi:tight adherence protein C